MLLFAGCAKDEILSENAGNNELKKANVPIPVKGEVCMVPNPDGEKMPVLNPYGQPIPGLTLVKTTTLYGFESHMGKLSEESFMTGISAKIDVEAKKQGRIVIIADYETTVFAANGDASYSITHSRIDVTDPNNMTITGTYESTGGTGRFENSSGSGTFEGVLPCWTIEGVMYKK